MAKRSLIDRILNRVGYIKQSTVGITSSQMFNVPSKPPAKTSEYLANYAQWVYACVRARATAVSKIKLKLFKVTDRKTGEFEQLHEHEALSLLRTVNPWMSFRELVKMTQIYKDLTGEAFWLLMKGGENSEGKIGMIWPLRPDFIEILSDRENFVKGYRYTVPGHEPINFRDDEIIHFKEFNPLDPHRGMSIVRAAAYSIDTDRYSKEWNRKFFENSAIPAIVLSTDQLISDETKERAKVEWQNEYGGRYKSHKMAILEGGLKLDRVNLSQSDLEFLEGQRFTRDEILAIFQVPKTVLGMTEQVTVSNADATYVVFNREVTKPEMETFVDFLNEFLLTQDEYAKEDLFFGFDDPIPENIEIKMTKYETLVRIGALTPNEVRGQEGLDEVEGLDQHYIQAQLVPIAGEDMVINPSEEEPVARTIKGKRVKGKKYNPLKDIVIPAKTLTKYVTDKVIEDTMNAIAPEIKEKLSKIMGYETEASNKVKRVEKQEDRIPEGKVIPIEQQELLWKQVIEKAGNFERSYRSQLRTFLNRQEKITLEKVVSNVKAIQKSDIDKILFSVTTENIVASRLLLPVVRELMQETGDDTLDFLGLSEQAFEVGTIEVREYLRREGLSGIRSMNKTTKSRLRKILTQAVKDGAGPGEVASRIRREYSDISRKRAEMIARTEIFKASNKATVEAYRQSGVVVGKQWFTALDERVCPMCAPLHGKVIALDNSYFEVGQTQVGADGRNYPIKFENIGEPPRHPRCRCIPLAITINTRTAKPDIKLADFNDPLMKMFLSVSKDVDLLEEEDVQDPDELSDKEDDFYDENEYEPDEEEQDKGEES